jgi:hypothetical protein
MPTPPGAIPGREGQAPAAAHRRPGCSTVEEPDQAAVHRRRARADRRRHHLGRHDSKVEIHHALEAGVEGVVILDGKVPHAVLLELLTDHGAGTLVMR